MCGWNALFVSRSCAHRVWSHTYLVCFVMGASVNWLKLPANIARRIRFLQLRDRLQAALETQPDPQVDFDKREVWVDFEFGDGLDSRPGCSLTYNWEKDAYEWFEDDNAYGESTFRESDGTVYTIDNHSAKFGFPNPLKSMIQSLYTNDLHND